MPCVLGIIAARGRTPSGVRGLKSILPGILGIISASHPVRGAWIEIFYSNLLEIVTDVAPRQGCVD